MRRHRSKSRKLYDPQGFFQHDLTYTQKKGMVVRPKPEQLQSVSSRSIPWTPEEMLDLLLQSGYINRVILHENINNVYTFAEDTYVAAGSTFEPLSSVLPSIIHLNISDRYTFAEDTYVAAGSTVDVDYPSEPTTLIISGDYTFSQFTQFAPQSQIIVNWSTWYPVNYASSGTFWTSNISFYDLAPVIPNFIYNDTGFSDFVDNIPTEARYFFDGLDIICELHNLYFYFPQNSATVNTSNFTETWSASQYYRNLIPAGDSVTYFVIEGTAKVQKAFSPSIGSKSCISRIVSRDCVQDYHDQTLTIIPLMITDYREGSSYQVSSTFTIYYNLYHKIT